jgi:hypothetical protein
LQPVTPEAHPSMNQRDDMSASFSFGRTYTREEIHDVLGGGLQEYLLQSDGRIVGACLNRKLNPNAPAVVLPGFGPKIEGSARLFAAQGDYVPTFMKFSSNAWEYVGEWRVRRLSEDEAEIAQWEARAGREDDVSMVLHLERRPVLVRDSAF